MVVWRGDAEKQRVMAAAAYAIDRVMSEAVIYAKNNHSGWQNRTGTLEGSVQVAQFAQVQNGQVQGVWGSVGVDYAIFVELKRGSFLRTAASVVYPRLPEYMKARLG